MFLRLNCIFTDADQDLHQHNLNGAVDLPSTSVGLASGCCAGGYAGAGTYSFDSTTTNDAVEFPFLLTPLCQKIANPNKI